MSKGYWSPMSIFLIYCHNIFMENELIPSFPCFFNSNVVVRTRRIYFPCPPLTLVSSTLLHRTKLACCNRGPRTDSACERRTASSECVRCFWGLSMTRLRGRPSPWSRLPPGQLPEGVPIDGGGPSDSGCRLSNTLPRSGVHEYPIV